MDALGIVGRLGQGRLIQDLADALSVVATEVVATKKPGAVTVTLKVLPSPAGDEMVLINDTIARKAPSREPRGAYLYAIEGQLFARDPRQTQLPFRAVTGEEEIREPAGEPSAVREA